MTLTATAGRRLWLAALMLYGTAALADMAGHLATAQSAGHDWRTPAHLVIAFSAGLFWPIDLVAEHLLSR